MTRHAGLVAGSWGRRSRCRCRTRGLVCVLSLFQHLLSGLLGLVQHFSSSFAGLVQNFAGSLAGLVEQVAGVLGGLLVGLEGGACPVLCPINFF